MKKRAKNKKIFPRHIKRFVFHPLSAIFGTFLVVIVVLTTLYQISAAKTNISGRRTCAVNNDCLFNEVCTRRGFCQRIYCNAYTGCFGDGTNKWHTWGYKDHKCVDFNGKNLNNPAPITSSCKNASGQYCAKGNCSSNSDCKKGYTCSNTCQCIKSTTTTTISRPIQHKLF